MRLPQYLIENLWFLHGSADAFKDAFPQISAEEFETAKALADNGLPPVTSLEVLSVLFGYNPGIVRAFAVNSSRYYRKFKIKSGKKVREISAPKVGLKLIQTWIGFHLSRLPTAQHVYGFIPGRSHIDAAEKHIGSCWSYSVDIQDFFGTTPRKTIYDNLTEIGYTENASNLLTNLLTLNDALPQGSPASPSLSNICFRDVDFKLSSLANDLNCSLSRFADDICFSGSGDFPEELPDQIEKIFSDTPWSINPEKIFKQPIKGRIKIHGLLVKEDGISLTKGYRNMIRAYRHLWLSGKIDPSDVKRIKGHLNFARQVESRPTCQSGYDWTDFDFDERVVTSHRQNPLIAMIRDFLKIPI